MRKGVVSVVLPIYNVEKYLSRCLESVVNQSYRKLEIILVDDESPDKCPEICDEWAAKDSRIKVIHKKNGGLGYARNTGIENATGEYICFVDSDDYIAPDTIEKAYKSGLIMSLEEYHEKRKAAQVDEAKELVKLYRERYGKEPDEHALHEFFWLFTNGEDELPECWDSMMRLGGNYEYSKGKLRKNQKKFSNMKEFLKNV